MDLKKIVTTQYIIKLLTGICLLFWAYKNLYPVEWVEYSLVEQHFADWYSAPIFSRLLIAIKFVIGAFLILNINPRNILTKALFIVVLFHFYDLVWHLANEDAIMVTSYSFIFGKNVAVALCMLILLAGVSVFLIYKSGSSDLKIKWLKYVFLVILFVLPFILNPVYPSDFKDMSQHIDKPFDTTSVASPELKELTENGVLVAYFSTNCQFCLNAARKISIERRQNPEFPPVYVCMLGTEDGAAKFFDKTNSTFEYDTMNAENMSQLSKLSFPRFEWVENGRVLHRWNGQTFNYYTMSTLHLISRQPAK